MNLKMSVTKVKKKIYTRLEQLNMPEQQCTQKKSVKGKKYLKGKRVLAHVLEERLVHMEEIKKEFLEYINLIKLSNLYFQGQKILGMSMKKCY